MTGITIKYAPGTVVEVRYWTEALIIDHVKVYEHGEMSYAMRNHEGHAIGFFDENEIVGVVE